MQMREGQTYYRHKPMGWGRYLTLAVRPSRGKFKVGWAWCSGEDQFSRKEGRRIADERLRGDDFLLFESTGDPITIMVEACDQVCQNRWPARWAAYPKNVGKSNPHLRLWAGRLADIVMGRIWMGSALERDELFKAAKIVREALGAS